MLISNKKNGANLNVTLIAMCTSAECNNCECSLSVLPFSELAEDIKEDSSGDESCMNEPDVSEI